MALRWVESQEFLPDIVLLGEVFSAFLMQNMPAVRPLHMKLSDPAMSSAAGMKIILVTSACWPWRM